MDEPEPEWKSWFPESNHHHVPLIGCVLIVCVPACLSVWHVYLCVWVCLVHILANALKNVPTFLRTSSDPYPKYKPKTTCWG